MENEINFNVLDCIEQIYITAKDCKFEASIFETEKENLALLSDYLQLASRETLLYAVAFVKSYENADFSGVFAYFGMTEFQTLKYQKEIDCLCTKKLLSMHRNYRRNTSSFEIPKFISKKIASNQALDFLILEERKGEEWGLVDILEDFDAKNQEHDCKDLNFIDFTFYMEELCSTHSDRPFFKEIKKYHLTNFEIYFLLVAMWDVVTQADNNFNTDVQSVADDFYPQKSTALRQLTAIAKGDLKLLKHNLIETSKANFRNGIKAKLSDKLMDFLNEHENLNIDCTEVSNKNLIQYANINTKMLFFNESEQNKLSDLTKIMNGEKFVQLQKRLSEKAMPTGICVIFYGSPGTGKTESVYQIAKSTGRNIFKVDISKTKSMWYGESEKHIKKIFDDYRHFQKLENICPILLLNEADAVLGKRKAAGSSNVADTENALQNILLEELENFEGILLATTNLVDNLDMAFERRFLFKIQFEKPNTESAAKIWASKLDFLSSREAKMLAMKYNFSGGEVENIARKLNIDQVLYDNPPSFDLVENFCKTEKWSSTSANKIGF